MRTKTLLACLLLGLAGSAMAEVSIHIGLSSGRIGVNVRDYPDFIMVPGYPVYYAPRLDSNVFFYDGFYWVYADDSWYASSWYDGPWDEVAPYDVPVYLLRVPVRYYRRPPVYFRGWIVDAPPRWGDHWGREWQQRRGGWDHWDRASAPRAAPLPLYQRQYSGDRYPRGDQQRSLREQNYRYQPREAIVRERFQQQSRPAPAPRQEVPAQRDMRGAPRQQDRPRQQDQPRQQQQPRQQDQPRQQNAPQGGARQPQSDRANQRQRGNQHDENNKGGPDDKGGPDKDKKDKKDH